MRSRVFPSRIHFLVRKYFTEKTGLGLRHEEWGYNCVGRDGRKAVLDRRKEGMRWGQEHKRQIRKTRCLLSCLGQSQMGTLAGQSGVKVALHRPLMPVLSPLPMYKVMWKDWILHRIFQTLMDWYCLRLVTRRREEILWKDEHYCL